MSIAPAAPWVKPVLTFDEAALKSAMQALWQKIEAQNTPPDCIVGIATGGLLCAQMLKPDLQIPILPCALRRPGTEFKKKSPVKWLLAALPYTISNAARRIEDHVQMRRAQKSTVKTIPPNTQLRLDVDAITAQVTAQKMHHLVIIDDAVDSGETLSYVVNTLRNALPADIKLTTAVITQTRSKTVFQPDVVLYHNMLCRFPWSFDFRGK